MALKYKVIEKGQPGVAGGGEKKFYASIRFNDEVTPESLVKQIEKFSALSEPDIIGVIRALENVIQDALAEGRIVRLEKLGSFYPTLSSKGEQSAEDVGKNSIVKTGVRYRPGKRILDSISEAGVSKDASNNT
jgi:predicted histone-like DNA-binding protein